MCIQRIREYMVPAINLSDRLYKELGRYGHRDETWNDVMARVLEYIDEDEALADKMNRTTSYEDFGHSPQGTGRDSEDSALQKLDNGTVLRHQYQRGNYSGAEVTAMVTDGKVEYNGKKQSPSGAAVDADQDKRGRDAMSSINGWTWWEYQTEEGDWIPIDSLRD